LFRFCTCTNFQGIWEIFKDFGRFSRNLGDFQGIWGIFKEFGDFQGIWGFLRNFGDDNTLHEILVLKIIRI